MPANQQEKNNPIEKYTKTSPGTSQNEILKRPIKDMKRCSTLSSKKWKLKSQCYATILKEDDTKHQLLLRIWSAYTLIVQCINQLNHFGKSVVSTKAEHTCPLGPSNSPKYIPNRNTCNCPREDMCNNAQNSTIPYHPIVETTHRCTYTRPSSSAV